MRIKLKPFFGVFTLLLLTACDNDTPRDAVRLLPIPSVGLQSTQANMTLGNVLDKRPVCDKTVWLQADTRDNSHQIEDQLATVSYQCDLSAAQTQALFAAQWAAWIAHYQRRLANSGQLHAAVLDKNNSQHFRAQLSTARSVFKQLQASGDLKLYKTLIKNSPARTQHLEAINVFFASSKGQAYLATTLKTKAQKATAQKALKAVTKIIAASGLATDTNDIDVCQTPALFVLAVVLTPEEVEKGLSECESSADQREQADIIIAKGDVDATRVILDKLNQPVRLISAKDTILWAVPVRGTPQVVTHTLVLDIKLGETSHQITKLMGIADSDFTDVLAGTMSSSYEKAFISAMADVVK
ncbi:hypothetical protein P2W49_22940 [Yersinia intermedia]|nr:hypothetical protein P2W49_22940 [Yersinia intermedia]